jgi:aminoglycoside 6'-N-acetyltransferase I
VRHATREDRDEWLRLRHTLWPDASLSEHAAEVDRFFRGQSTDPAAVIVAEGPGCGLAGFAELSIRPYAEGCSTDHVGYLEGWFVEPAWRRRGTGRALVKAAEAWARAQGCTEFASDAEADNDLSAQAHHALGFAEVGLIRCFRKDLVDVD